MSSPDEVSVWGTGFGPEGGERAGVRPAGRGAEPRKPPSGGGGSGCRDPKGFQSEREMLEAGGPVLCGREGRPGSPDDDTRDLLDLFEESAAGTTQQLYDRDVLNFCRYPLEEPCASFEVSAGLEAGPGRPGATAQSCGEAPPALAGPLHLGGPEAGRAWRKPKRATKRRLNVAADRQRFSYEGRARQLSDSESSDEFSDTKRRLNVAADRQRFSYEALGLLLSDSECSDEFSDTELMTVSTYSGGGGQAEPSRPEDPGDTPSHSNFQVRENFLPVTGSSLSSALRGLSSVVERQGVGEQGISSPKKMQSVLWGNGGSKPSYPGAAAAAATAGGLPQVTPRKKGTLEKKSLGGASTLALGKNFPSWGQRIWAPPLEPATFPPVSGIPLLGRSKRYTLVPSGTKQAKHTSAGKKSVVTWTRESEAVAGEDKDPNRDPAPKGQLPAHKPGTPYLRMHRGKASSGEVDTRGPQDPGNSEPLALNQGEVMPRGPAPSGDWEPLDHPPRPETPQQPLGMPGCPSVEPIVFLQEGQLRQSFQVLCPCRHSGECEAKYRLETTITGTRFPVHTMEASNHSVHTGGKVKPEEKYCPKPSGPGYIPDQCGDCHHTWEKPNFLRALNSGPSGPNPTPERAVRAIEQRSSPSSHLILALAPSTPDLFPTRAVTATTP
ncbi:uncharacterized protein CXorf49 homolog [Mesoplodon densirostris]|uniref:uncharacterized protein CXorf49 homolog n=1 Tax=Mesoplodon densirostris TaxID=48708 RepID=UPI0028DB5D05|nr:uncharacterized protein CXorf49 homolog [Mesoplodon densirostris]XP_059942474.1 uncharacterized protein CXorf49 homolog [Mesoplodon densirostris]